MYEVHLYTTVPLAIFGLRGSVLAQMGQQEPHSLQSFSVCYLAPELDSLVPQSPCLERLCGNFSPKAGL